MALLMHSPLLKHGLERQELIVFWHKLPLKPAAHTHWNVDGPVKMHVPLLHGDGTQGFTVGTLTVVVVVVVVFVDGKLLHWYEQETRLR